MTHLDFTRRRLLGGAAALSAAGSAGFARRAFAAAAPKLPARGNFVIRNAYVMTMETGTGDITDGDVHVRDGVIVAVGPNLDAPGARTIDGRGMIVLPGFVETHWHMWNTLLRSMAGEKPEYGYFRTTAALGRAVHARMTCTRARGSPPPRRSTPASPSCTTGATTSAAPTMREPICGR